MSGECGRDELMGRVALVVYILPPSWWLCEELLTLYMTELDRLVHT